MSELIKIYLLVACGVHIAYVFDAPKLNLHFTMNPYVAWLHALLWPRIIYFHFFK